MKLYHDRTVQYKQNMRHTYITVLTNFVHAMLLTFPSIYFLCKGAVQCDIRVKAVVFVLDSTHDFKFLV